MPTNFSTSIFTGTSVAIDDYFVTADSFRQGNLWTWGLNTSGQLGDNTTTQRNTPITTFAGGTNWKQVSGGNAHTAAIKTDGTLWTWGANGYGRLGNNTTTQRNTPVTTFAGGTNWKQVDTGRDHTAAIKTDGTLWNWGDSANGQLGNNVAFSTRSTPITTFAGGTDWKQVSAGSRHTAAIKTDGTLWIWGNAGYGRLGDNTSFFGGRSTPVTTFAGGTNWKQVSCGNFHTAAIKTDGTLWTWGRNHYAQLGDNTTTNRSIPVTTFAGGTDWKQVKCGYDYVPAIKTDGTLWTWGRNTNGGLGVNDTNQRNTPVTTFAGGTNWKQVVGGYLRTVAIKTDGTLWTWGLNNVGQLGDNTTTERNTPVTTFAGGTNWKQVDGIILHTAALTYIDDYQ